MRLGSFRLLVLTLTAALLLAACGSAPAAQAPTAAPTDAPAAPTAAAAATAAPTAAAAATVAPTAAASPTEGKQLIFGSVFEPKIINGLSSEQVSKWITDLVFDGLVRANQRQELVGQLAESWEISPDGTVYTFKLRPNVTFHDGAPLTADDVIFTYETALNPPEGLALLSRSNYTGITNSLALDPLTVQFTLDKPDASFLSKLQAGILPAHLLHDNPDWAAFHRAPVGSGPWKLARWETGQQIVFAANPDYFQGAPGLDQLIWKVVPDATVLSTQLESGEIDAAFVAPSDLARVQANSALKTAEWLGALTYIGLNHDRPLFQDVKLRQALNLGVDRQLIIDEILQGQAVLGASHITPNNWAYNSEAPAWPYDPAQAKALLDEAGWTPGPDGIRVKDGTPLRFVLLTNSEQPERRDITQLVREQWRAIGVDVELQYLELNTFINERVLKSDFDAILLAATVNVDPDYLRALNPTGFLKYNNPQVSDLLTQGRLLTSQAERKPIYDQVQQLAAEDAALVPLFYPQNVIAYRADLQGVAPTDLNVFWNTWTWKLAP
jgi:peptide/nickel transport system substrate-binding protein